MSPARLDELWMVGADADSTAPDARHKAARSLEEILDSRGDWVVLSTCHRIEAYGFGQAPQVLSLDPRWGEAAASHLLRVAAGLESAVVGEDEVLHQVREALRTARHARPLSGELARLFELAVAAGRRSRAGRTAVGAGLAGRAIEWLQQRTELSDRPILIVGAGRMGSALAHAAHGVGARLTIASRDPDRARRLARIHAGVGVDLATGAELARSSAAVAVALTGPWHELASGPLPPTADLSAPTALSAAARAGLADSFLGIDDLFGHAAPPPPGYVRSAEAIVGGRMREYANWLDRRLVFDSALGTR